VSYFPFGMETDWIWVTAVFLGLSRRKKWCRKFCKDLITRSESHLLYNWRSVGQSFGLGVESLCDSWPDFGCIQGICGFVCHGASSL